MAYIEARNKFTLSAINCNMPSSILINYGVEETIFITAATGYTFDSTTNKLTGTVYHKNGTTRNLSISYYGGNQAYFTYGGTSGGDTKDDIIFIWGYGSFLPTYPTVANNITKPSNVTLSASTAIEGETFAVLITPRVSGTTFATGYGFKNITATYNENTVTAQLTVLSYSNGGYRVYSKLENVSPQNQTVTVNGVCGKSVNYSKYAPNATISGIETPILNSETLNITVTANSGYYFQTVPTLAIVANNTILTTLTFNLNASDTAATVGTLQVDLTQYPTVTAVSLGAEAIEQPTPTYTIINNIANTTIQTSIDGDMITATITPPNSRYAYPITPKVYYTRNGVGVETELTLTENVSDYCIATCTIYADLGTVRFEGTLERRVFVDAALTNCVIVGNTPFYMFVKQTYNLQFQSNDDFCFQIAPTLTAWITGYGSEDVDAVLDNNEPHLGALLTINLTDYFEEDARNITSIDLTANAVAITAYNYGAINVYKVDTQTLNSFAAYRLFIENGFRYDLGDYVITLKRLYFTVGRTVTDVLKCGNWNTNISVQTLIKDTVNIDCGAVTIPQYANNSIDYSEEISAFLPFVGFVDVSSDYVGKTISLSYECSAVTGKGFAKLECNGIVFATYSANVSDNLIFKAITDNAQINQLEFNKYNGLQPYIIVKHNADLTEQITNSENKRGVISTFGGYIQCKEIDNLTAVIPSDIREMIIAELEKGVYL